MKNRNHFISSTFSSLIFYSIDKCVVLHQIILRGVVIGYVVCLILCFNKFVSKHRKYYFQLLVECTGRSQNLMYILYVHVCVHMHMHTCTCTEHKPHSFYVYLNVNVFSSECQVECEQHCIVKHGGINSCSIKMKHAPDT